MKSANPIQKQGLLATLDSHPFATWFVLAALHTAAFFYVLSPESALAGELIPPAPETGFETSATPGANDQSSPRPGGGGPDGGGSGGENPDGGTGGDGGDGGSGGGSTSGLEFREIDGWNNNLVAVDTGATNTQLMRSVWPDYADGIAAMAGADRPSARAISNIVAAQSESVPNVLGASDYIWQWGQFLDHDIDLTEGADPAESANIVVPTGDAYFDPFATGTEVIGLSRSVYDVATGVDAANPREQMNGITAWIDGSNVYGSDTERATALRANDGTGRMAVTETEEGDLLPFNVDGFANAGGPSDTLFLAGDIRANEQVALTAMHTLFVREHNRLAKRIAKRDRDLSGDDIYEQARRLVGAEIQAITFREFLPALLGPGAVSPYPGYDETVDSRIRNVFSTASYRYGHSQLSSTLLRLDRRGNEVSEGHLALRDAFFSPSRLTDEGGIDPILRGLGSQVAQAVDPLVVDDVRNFLFGPPGSGGFDLVSLNIQRGRDHGLPSYNDVREAYGLARKVSFAEVTDEAAMQLRLADAYGDVDSIDVWVGGLAEDASGGGLVGELIGAVVAEQFMALRDGDRLWYEASLTRREVRVCERMTLSKIIRKNTRVRREVGRNAFVVGS